MKKTILLSSLFAVGAAFAAATEVDSGNAVGALDLSVSNNVQQQTLISVPFVGYETDDAVKVKVKDMVKTSNLANGSKLYVADGNGGYHTWKLFNGAWVADNKVTIGAGGQPVEGAAADQDDFTVNRGDSFWLEPVFAESATSGTIYLLGQKGDGEGSSRAAVKWNLLGNASVDPVTLSNAEDSGFANGEQVVVQVNGKLRYWTYKTSKGGWYYVKNEGTRSTGEPLTIAAGQGFWFRSTASKTINWSTGKAAAAQ